MVQKSTVKKKDTFLVLFFPHLQHNDLKQPKELCWWFAKARFNQILSFDRFTPNTRFIVTLKKRYALFYNLSKTIVIENQMKQAHTDKQTESPNGSFSISYF